MATAYNQVLVNDLDVVTTYKKLMGASIGTGSIYLKAKETMLAFLKDSTLKDTEKSAIISEMMVGLTTQITAKTLDSAIALDKLNRDAKYELTKLKEDTKLVTAQIAKIEKDELDTDWAIKNRVMAGWKVQAELHRDYGVKAWNLNPGTTTLGVYTVDDVIPMGDYDTYGIKVETIKKAKADIYQGYAQGYRANGYVSVVLNSDGSIANSTAADTNGLTWQQTAVAKRQEQGFEDNKKQHVVNSSASLMSTLLATEASGIDYDPYLLKWSNAVDYLNSSWSGSTSGATAGTISVLLSDTLSNTAVFNISGSSVNISAGRSVLVEFRELISVGVYDNTIYAGTGLIQLDGTWSIEVATTVTSLLTDARTCYVTVKTTDDTGSLRSIELTKTVV